MGNLLPVIAAPRHLEHLVVPRGLLAASEPFRLAALVSAFDEIDGDELRELVHTTGSASCGRRGMPTETPSISDDTPTRRRRI